MPTKQVFISYKREERPRVQELADNLRRAGNTVWFDESLQVGDHWWDAILGQIEQCDVFVFAISQRALRSIACQHERAYAAALGKPLLLIQVGPLTAVPTEYAMIQYGNFSKGDPRALIDLIGGINRLPTGQSNNPNVARPTAPIAPIEELAAIIDTQTALDFKDQAAILFRLKQAIEGPQARTRALELVEVLSKRTEFVKIQEDCKAIIATNKAPKRPPVALLILSAVVLLAIIMGIGGITLATNRNSVMPTITLASVALIPTTVGSVLPTLPPTRTLTPSLTNTSRPIDTATVIVTPSITNSPQPTGTPTITFTPSITDTLRPTNLPTATSVLAASGVTSTFVQDFSVSAPNYLSFKGYGSPNSPEWRSLPLSANKLSAGMGILIEFQADFHADTTGDFVFQLTSGDSSKGASLTWGMGHGINGWQLTNDTGTNFETLLTMNFITQKNKWYYLLWHINSDGTIDTLIWSKDDHQYLW